MRGFLVVLWILWMQAALAQGFALHDLTVVAGAAGTALGRGSTVRPEAQHLSLHCPTCAGAPTVDLRIGRLTDGTEERVRAGKTSLGALEAMCVRRNPDCRLSGLAAGPAVGWISIYGLEQGAGATAVILRDGDLLTIEARASTRGTAEDSLRRLASAVLPPVVGP
jgi:hypothetical protein